MFRHFSGCGFAWLRHDCFVFSGFQKHPKAMFRHFSGCSFAMAWAQNLLGFCFFRMRVPNTFFLSFAWWLARFQVLRCVKVCLAVSHGLGTISLFLVGATFGDFFQAVVSQWLGHKTCWGAAFSHACPRLTDQRSYFETMSERF